MHHKFRLVGLVGAMLGFLLAATPITAHHAIQAQFDQDRLATITGVMRRVMWINPHVRWFLDVEDENGDVTSWNISGSGPGAFGRVGISGRDVFVTGETYTATIALAKDGSDFGYIVSFILPDGRKIDLWHQYQSEG